MAKVPYSVETLPKISIVWVGRTNVTDRQTDDRRQTTDDRQTDGRTTTYSEHELEFTFANKTFPLTYETSDSRLCLQKWVYALIFIRVGRNKIKLHSWQNTTYESDLFICISISYSSTLEEKGKKTHAHKNYNKTTVKTKLYIVSQSWLQHLPY